MEEIEDYLLIKCPNTEEEIKIPISDLRKRIKLITFRKGKNIITDKDAFLLAKETIFREFLNKEFAYKPILKPYERIRKNEFKEKYKKYISQKGKSFYLLSSKEIDNYMKENYEKPYIKSNGLMYVNYLIPSDRW